jgi:hypothetical protein
MVVWKQIISESVDGKGFVAVEDIGLLENGGLPVVAEMCNQRTSQCDAVYTSLDMTDSRKKGG